MPLDASIVAEAVYTYSTTMDGRHFGDEFVRRKKLADKGIVEKEPLDTKANSNGGWNEVAKKGGSASGPSVAGGGAPLAKDDPAGIPGFRVVPNKKNKAKK
jgi:PERQ amino acid-rich with GYF domain-containing protein